MDEELTVRGKKPTETGEQHHETKIFLHLLRKYIICSGVAIEREFATEIQEIEAQILHTIKILLRTFTCRISVMHRTCARHTINIQVYNTVTALSTTFLSDTHSSDNHTGKKKECTNITYTSRFFQIKFCFYDSLQTENLQNFIICKVLELALQANYLTNVYGALTAAFHLQQLRQL